MYVTVHKSHCPQCHISGVLYNLMYLSYHVSQFTNHIAPSVQIQIFKVFCILSYVLVYESHHPQCHDTSSSGVETLMYPSCRMLQFMSHTPPETQSHIPPGTSLD